jgi:hypothetical protein
MTSYLAELNNIKDIMVSLEESRHVLFPSIISTDSLYDQWEQIICGALTIAIERQTTNQVDANRACEFMGELLAELARSLSRHPSWDYPLVFSINSPQELVITIYAFLEFFKKLIEIEKTLTLQSRSLGG